MSMTRGEFLGLFTALLAAPVAKVVTLALPEGPKIITAEEMKRKAALIMEKGSREEPKTRQNPHGYIKVNVEVDGKAVGGTPHYIPVHSSKGQKMYGGKGDDDIVIRSTSEGVVTFSDNGMEIVVEPSNNIYMTRSGGQCIGKTALCADGLWKELKDGRWQLVKSLET